MGQAPPHRSALEAAYSAALEYLQGLGRRRVGAEADAASMRGALGGPLPEQGEAPARVVEELAKRADPGIVASAGPRFFGFVIGGSLPAAVGADWLTSVWDQNAGLFVLSPAAAIVEETVLQWLTELFGLPEGTGVGFVTGGQMANTTCLAAARHSVLARAGWDVAAKGLQGAPPVAVILGDEAHVTVYGALRLLGLGDGFDSTLAALRGSHCCLTSWACHPSLPLRRGDMDFDIAFEERLAFASTLPSAFYTDPAVLEVELAKVFGRTWQLVGREQQAASPGQFFTCAVAEEPIVVARGLDDKLRALSNVCRHRAGPVAAGEGSCQSFRCGYHGWRYALDGRLLATPEFEGVENFRKEEHSLPQFRVESWLGLTFVNADSSARSLAETVGDLAERLSPARLASMRLAARKEWTVQCNWKVYVDNYLEGYHIPIVHPGLMQELDYARYRAETRGAYSVQHAPLKKNAPGRVVRRGGSAAADEARYFWIFPNLMLNVYPDNLSTNLILPIGHDRTLTIFDWFFDDPESPEVREALRETIELSDEIQREDIAICEAVQKGLRSRTYQSGRYSVLRESGVHHFHGMLIRALLQS